MLYRVCLQNTFISRPVLHIILKFDLTRKTGIKYITVVLTDSG